MFFNTPSNATARAIVAKRRLRAAPCARAYMATRNEKDTTRARANILREMLTRSPKENRFDHKEIKEVYDLCLSCKGCKSECPSNVDVAKLKAEFLQHYYDANGVPIRSRLIANFARLSSLAVSRSLGLEWRVRHPCAPAHRESYGRLPPRPDYAVDG